MNFLECGDGLPIVTIVNVSSTFSLQLKLNICKIAMTMKDIPALVNKKEISTMRIQTESAVTHRTANLVYENGRVIVTGACFEEMSRLCARSFVAMLHQKKIPASMKGFCINNITGVIDLGFFVNLAQAGEYMENLNCMVIYNVMQYPALRLREVKGIKGSGRMSSLVYPNGKCIVTGVKTRGALADAVRWLVPHMENFRQTAEGAEAMYRQGLASDAHLERLIDEIVACGEVPEYMFDRKYENELIKFAEGKKVAVQRSGPVRKERGASYVYVMPTDQVLELSTKYDPVVMQGDYSPCIPATKRKREQPAFHVPAKIKKKSAGTKKEQ